MRQSSARSWVRRAVASALLPLLAACGGGLWVSLGDLDGDGRDPSVSLVTGASSAAPGGTLAVAAAAADADGIEEVAFYRRDGSAWVFLGSDRQPPYEWVVPVPADGRSTLEVLARATDRSGDQGESAVLVVTVRR
jgi:hypothetical protein